MLKFVTGVLVGIAATFAGCIAVANRNPEYYLETYKKHHNL